MKITLHIVGGGAIGSLIAMGAQKHGVNYALYPRNVSSAPRKGYWLNGEPLLLANAKPCPCYPSSDDVVVIPLKVYQLAEALTSWLPYLRNKPTVVLLHNGMGGVEIAENILPKDYPLLVATTSHGAYKKNEGNGDYEVVYTGLGKTQIGAPNKGITAASCHKVVTLLNGVLPPFEYRQDILSALWAKLSINAVINPLTALNNIKNKHIADAQFASVREALCEEFCIVANACGVNVDAQTVHENVLSVAKATGENYSSMHQDVAHGRQTEIDAINGYIVDMATKKGIAVPENTLLVERVKALKL